MFDMPNINIKKNRLLKIINIYIYSNFIKQNKYRDIFLKIHKNNLLKQFIIFWSLYPKVPHFSKKYIPNMVTEGFF